MRTQRRGVRLAWRICGLLLTVWVAVLPLMERSNPLRAAAFAAQPQGVLASASNMTEAQSAPSRYLIIAPDEFAPGLAGYIAAKQAEGYDVIFKTLSQIGSSAAQIRAVILFYSPQFLLLVGDVGMLPAWPSRNGLSTSTDLYYATLDGAWDYTPNLAYARLPVHSTAELQAVLAKWADYRALDGSQAWLGRVAFVAGDEANESIHNQMIEQYTQPAGFNGRFPNNPQPGGDRLYVHAYAAAKTDLAAALNEGRGLAVYFGQGSRPGWMSPYFTAEDVTALTGPPLPLLVSFASRTAELDEEQTSFAEAWLLHPTSGALAVIAAGADTTHTADERLERELFHGLFSNAAAPPPLGEALRTAFLAFGGYYLPGETLVKQYYEMYSLWGDPTLRLWLDAPRRFSLSLEPNTLSVCGGLASSPSVEVGLASSLTQMVALSLLNPPQGVSGTFSPNPVGSPGSAALTLTIPAELPAGYFPLTVQGLSSAFQQAAALSLMVRPAAPSDKPLPLLPANGAMRVSLRPQLSWSAVSGADGYDVQIGLDADFSPIVEVFEDIAQTTLTLSRELQPSQTYYWRVRAKNGCGAGDYSPVAQFTTLPPPGECLFGSQSELLYRQSFDAVPTDGWLLQNGWEVSGAFGRGGVARAAAPAEISQKTLTSPLLSLPDDASVLAVWVRAEMAYEFGEPPACLDGGLLEISTDDGQTWFRAGSEVLLNPPYEGTLAVSFGNPLGGSPAWCHRRDWSPLAVDLTAYRGQEVRLRFVVASGADEQSAEGLALDNFEAVACRAESPVRRLAISPAEQSAILPAGAAASFVWRVSNTGGQNERVEISISGELPADPSPQSFALNAGESQEIRVEVRLPDSAAPESKYRLDLTARSQENSSVWAAASLELTVQRCGLQWSVPEDIPPLSAGQDYLLQIVLTNTGNAADTFRLSAVDQRNWRVVTPDVGPIQMGESALLYLPIAPPENAPPGETNRLRLTAHSEACPSFEQSLERLLVIQGSRLFLPVIRR